MKRTRAALKRRQRDYEALPPARRMVFLSAQTDAKGGASALLSPGGVYYLTEAPPRAPRIWTIENEHGSVLGYLHEREETREDRPGACCDRNVRRGRSTVTDQDGDLWTCPDCDRRWVHVCDEAEGCSWVPAAAALRAALEGPT